MSTWWFQIFVILRFSGPSTLPVGTLFLRIAWVVGHSCWFAMGTFSWGSKGDSTKWHVDFDNLHVGTKVDLVANIVSVGDGGTSALVTLFPCSTRAHIVGLTLTEGCIDSVSIFGAQFNGSNGMPTFEAVDGSLVMTFPKPNFSDLMGLIETCAGMGFATEGFEQMGFQPKVANELREPLAASHQQLHPGIPIVIGDVNLPQTVWKLWDRCRKAFPLFAGFSCQPFSKGGPQRGGDDSRANSLPATIKAAFMLRAPIIVLECVKDASQNNFVLQILQDFCNQCRYHRTEVVLALEQCWAGKRERWWTVMSTHFLGPIKLRPFPDIPFPCKLHQIQPSISLTQTEILQLELTTEEYELILQYVGDPRCMLPQWNAKAPTALHSWGSQMAKCPCGRRDMGFSHQTLSKGIYGRLLQLEGLVDIQGREFPRMRHPHPVEVAVWNCLLPKPTWPANLKLLLSGLGQMAIPLQSSWIAGHIQAHLEIVLWGSTKVDCHAVLEKTRADVLAFVEGSKASGPSLFVETVPRVLPVAERNGSNSIDDDQSMEPPVVEHDMFFSQAVEHAFPPWVGTPHMGDSSSFTLVCNDLSMCTQIALSKPESTCVGNVIAAEIGLHPTAGYLSLVDCITQDEVPHEQLVAGRSLCLQEEPLSFQDIDTVMDWDGYGEPTTCSIESDVHVVSPTVPFSVSEIAQGMVPLPECPKDEDVAPKNSEMMDPLCALTAEQLLKVDAPIASSMIILKSVLDQTISSYTRQKILENQGSVWADDEVRFHVTAILKQAGKSHIGFLDPLLITELMCRPSCAVVNSWWKSFDQAPTNIVGLACVAGHWIPFQCNWTADCFYVSSWDDGPGQFPKALRDVFDIISKHVGSRTVQIRVEHRRFPTHNHCGVCAVRYIDHVVRGRMLPTEFPEVRILHEQGRQRFVDHLIAEQYVGRPWLWGAGLDHQLSARLQDLLKQHGVPEHQLATRTHLIVQMIGTHELQGALLGSMAWRALKSLANQCKPPLQLVLAEELNAQVQKRAKEGKVGAKRSKKTGDAKSPNTGPPKLDPGKLSLDAGVFTKPDGTPLSQLGIDAIGPFAEGVVLGTIADCLAYLQAGQNVNNLSLGIFIINASSQELCTRLPCTDVRIPLRCVANREPVLVAGQLVQLGSLPVHVGKHKPAADIEAPTAVCVKIAIYRDSVDGQWADVCRAPIKYLIANLPALNCCDQTDAMDCSCSKWHPPSENQIQDPILDVWRRQWVTLQFKPTAMESADIFLVNLRCIADQEENLLSLSGAHGIYIEPRSLDAREPNRSFQVIWLSNVNLAEAVRLKQCNPLVLGLARIGSRLGLRVKMDDAEEVGKAVRPGSIILGAGPKMEFEVGPLPFGMDRLSVSRMCTAWGWQARPLHAIRVVNGQQGSIWLVQSSVSPPNNVFPMKHGDVLVSKLPPKEQSNASSTTNIVGSSATLELCRLHESRPVAIDPLQIKDPWSNYVSKVQVPAAETSSGLGLKQVEDRIEKAVLAKLPNATSDESKLQNIQTAADARFVALEQQVTMLTQQHENMEKHIEASGKHQDAQLNQLRVQVKAQLDAQGHQMESLFKQQMANIEGLLSKRSRSRSRHE